MPGELWWWRVEFDSSGTVLSCERVEPTVADHSHGTVFFVESDTSVKAETLAYRRYLTAQRVALKKRRERHQENGKCRCGRAPKAGCKTCCKCLAADAKSAKRSAAKASGRPVEPLPPKSAAIAEGARVREAQAILETLREVREKFQRSPSVRLFGEWLEKRLEQAQEACRERIQ